MKLEDVFRAANLDFHRDFEPITKREEEAFIEGFKYGINAIIAFVIDNAKGGNNDEKRN